MSRDEILRVLSEHRDEITAMGVKSIAVFGSVARNEARDDSDVDVLVEFGAPATYDRYMELKEYLESALHRSVDLVTSKAVKPKMRPYIEKDAVYVA